MQRHPQNLMGFGVARYRDAVVDLDQKTDVVMAVSCSGGRCGYRVDVDIEHLFAEQPNRLHRQTGFLPGFLQCHAQNAAVAIRMTAGKNAIARVVTEVQQNRVETATRLDAQRDELGAYRLESEARIEAWRQETAAQFREDRDWTEAQFREDRDWTEAQFREHRAWTEAQLREFRDQLKAWREETAAQFKEHRDWTEAQLREHRDWSEAQLKELRDQLKAWREETAAQLVQGTPRLDRSTVQGTPRLDRGADRGAPKRDARMAAANHRAD